MLQEILSEKIRFIKFATVGCSGTVINLSIVWLGNSWFFTNLGEPHQTWVSYALGIIVSIFSNYILNSFWTWRDRRGHGLTYFFRHLLKYYLANMVAASLQFLIANGIAYSLKVFIFTEVATIPVIWKMSASIIGISLAGVINFLINHFWNFNVSVNKKVNSEI